MSIFVRTKATWRMPDKFAPTSDPTGADLRTVVAMANAG
jgi:hypothetical protein